MAGIESFQQSGLKTSRPSFFTRSKSDEGRERKVGWVVSVAKDMGIAMGGVTSMRQNANTSEMRPLRISFISTAVAAEYAREGGIDTLE